MVSLVCGRNSRVLVRYIDTEYLAYLYKRTNPYGIACLHKLYA